MGHLLFALKIPEVVWPITEREVRAYLLGGSACFDTVIVPVTMRNVANCPLFTMIQCSIYVYIYVFEAGVSWPVANDGGYKFLSSEPG